MTISTERTPARVLARKHERRAERELVLELVFRPLSGLLARLLLRTRVSPPAVVLANAVAGILAAAVLARGELVTAALLLQLKTLLDNADGRLARMSGRVTLVGRYLDTEADLVVNAALFAALAHVTGQPWLALVAFLALTLVLATDFNASQLYREARGDERRVPTASGGRVEQALETTYRLVFAPQDHLVRSFSARRFERVLAGERPTHPATLAYHDRFTVAALANFGLSTQLAALGVCLLLGAPDAYFWLVLGCLAVLPLLQVRRERMTRHALAQ